MSNEMMCTCGDVPMFDAESVERAGVKHRRDMPCYHMTTPTPPDRSVEEIVAEFYKAFPLGGDTWVLERHQNAVVEWLRTTLTSLYHQGFEAGRRDGTNLEMVKGYNREKEILSNRLTQLMTSNATISTRSSIQTRLREIDEALATLKHPNV